MSSAADVPGCGMIQSGSSSQEIGHEETVTKNRIIGFLREAEADVAVGDLFACTGSKADLILQWRSKFGGMSVSEAKRLRELEVENSAPEEAAGGVDAGERGHQGCTAKKW